MSEKKKAEPKAEKKPEKVDIEIELVNVDEFIARKLKVINELPNKAKAKALADRVLRNKEVKY